MQNLAAAGACCQAMGLASEFDRQHGGLHRRGAKAEVMHDDASLEVRGVSRLCPRPVQTQSHASLCGGTIPLREVTAVFELHTFSSLNKTFIPQYKDAMNAVDHAIVYFDPDVVRHKRLPELDASFVRSAFGRNTLEVITDKEHLPNVACGRPHRKPRPPDDEQWAFWRRRIQPSPTSSDIMTMNPPMKPKVATSVYLSRCVSGMTSSTTT